MQKKNSKTSKCDIRLSQEEFELFKEKAAAFGSLSSMIRKAVECLDNQVSKHKIDWLEEFSQKLHHNNVLLSHISGNLNQVVKRANELAVKQSLPFSFFEQELYPEIVEVNKQILELKQVQKKVFLQALKLT